MTKTINLGLIAHANHGKTELLNSILEALGKKGKRQQEKKKDMTTKNGCITIHYKPKNT